MVTTYLRLLFNFYWRGIWEYSTVWMEYVLFQYRIAEEWYWRCVLDSLYVVMYGWKQMLGGQYVSQYIFSRCLMSWHDRVSSVYPVGGGTGASKPEMCVINGMCRRCLSGYRWCENYWCTSNRPEPALHASDQQFWDWRCSCACSMMGCVCIWGSASR